MSKKRAPKTKANLPTPDADATLERTEAGHPVEAADAEVGFPLDGATSSVEREASVEDVPESERRPKGKKSKRDKKNRAAKATEGDKQEKGEKKAKRRKKDKKGKKEKALKASKRDQDQEQDEKAQRDETRGKKDKSTASPKLRPLRKVNVVLIEPNGQPRAHFDGEIGVLELLLPKKAEGDDSGM